MNQKKEIKKIQFSDLRNSGGAVFTGWLTKLSGIIVLPLTFCHLHTQIRVQVVLKKSQEINHKQFIRVGANACHLTKIYLFADTTQNIRLDFDIFQESSYSSRKRRVQ